MSTHRAPSGPINQLHSHPPLHSFQMGSPQYLSSLSELGRAAPLPPTRWTPSVSRYTSTTRGRLPQRERHALLPDPHHFALRGIRFALRWCVGYYCPARHVRIQIRHDHRRCRWLCPKPHTYAPFPVLSKSCLCLQHVHCRARAGPQKATGGYQRLIQICDLHIKYGSFPFMICSAIKYGVKIFVAKHAFHVSPQRVSAYS